MNTGPDEDLPFMEILLPLKIYLLWKYFFHWGCGSNEFHKFMVTFRPKQFILPEMGHETEKLWYEGNGKYLPLKRKFLQILCGLSVDDTNIRHWTEQAVSTEDNISVQMSSILLFKDANAMFNITGYTSSTMQWCSCY